MIDMILSFFSSFTSLVIDTLLIVGVLGLIVSYFIKHIPILSGYCLPINLISTLLVVFGTYHQGMMVCEKKYQEQITKMELQIKDAEIQTQKSNIKLESLINQRVSESKKHSQKIKEVIKYKTQQINADCKNSKDIIDILNGAARGHKK